MGGWSDFFVQIYKIQLCGLLYEYCEGGDLKTLLKRMRKRAVELFLFDDNLFSSLVNGSINYYKFFRNFYGFNNYLIIFSYGNIFSAKYYFLNQ